MMNRFLPDFGLPLLIVTLLLATTPALGQGWINEIHYDNISTDTGEFVEVVLQSTEDPALYDVILYNGSGGGTYGSTYDLDVDFVEGNTVNGFVFYTLSLPTDGLQNGAPDGIALCDEGGVVSSGSTPQFLSYEGSFTATSGCAAGVTSTDIGVSESNSTTAIGESLQLQGTGGDYEDFSWAGPSSETPGRTNTGQTLVSGPPPPTVQFEIAADTKTEGDVDLLYTIVLTLTNANNDESVAVDLFFDAGASSPTATNADIGGFDSASLSLGVGDDSEVVEITITGDDIEEPSEDFVFGLTITAEVGGVVLGSPETFTLTVNDNDFPPIIDKTLVITEFMADPVAVSDANGEWVEVFNNTEDVIDLDGYFLEDGGVDSHEIAASVPVPAGGFAVLCRNADTETNGGISCDYEYSGFNLTNGDDEIFIIDVLDNVVDEVIYTGAWVGAGFSTAYLGSPNGDNDVLENWADSIAREDGFDDGTLLGGNGTPLGDDGSPGKNGVHGNLASPFGASYSAYCYSQASGDWSNPLTWANCPNGVPGAGEAAAILGGVTVEVTSTTPSTGSAAIVVVESGATLNVNAALSAEVVTVAGDLEVRTSGALNVGRDLSVQGTLVTNDAVTLLEGANGPATLTNEFGSITGSLTASRAYVVAPTDGGGSFRGIFPPFEGVTFNQLNDGFQTQGGTGSDFPEAQPTLYTFNAPTQTFFPVTDYTDVFDPDSGYVFYMFDFEVENGPTWEVTGTVRDEYSLALTYNDDADPDNDFNWVPQPFAGPLDFKELFLASTLVSDDEINATLYILDPATEEFRTYNALTGAGIDTGAGGAGRYVAPFQSFVVQTVATGAVLNYDYDLKDTAQSPLIVGRSDGAVGDEVAPHVRLRIQGENELDGLGSAQTYLVFYERGVKGYDAGDASMLYPFSPRYATLVLMDESGRELSMDARGSTLSVEEFQARVAATEPGTYTLSWPDIHQIPASWQLILTDLETGTEVDLRSQQHYTFEVASATAARRSNQLGALHPAQRTTSARFQISVSNGSTTDESPGAVPAASALDEVYPNPFAATATVRYRVARATDVRLTVYDLLGREVAHLAEGPHEAGHHTATLSGAALASGVYFVRMIADDFATTKKVVVLD